MRAGRRSSFRITFILSQMHRHMSCLACLALACLMPMLAMGQSSDVKVFMSLGPENAPDTKRFPWERSIDIKRIDGIPQGQCESNCRQVRLNYRYYIFYCWMALSRSLLIHHTYIMSKPPNAVSPVCWLGHIHHVLNAQLSYSWTYPRQQTDDRMMAPSRPPQSP